MHFIMVHSNTNNANCRVRQLHVCYLRITYSSVLKVNIRYLAQNENEAIAKNTIISRLYSRLIFISRLYSRLILYLLSQRNVAKYHWGIQYVMKVRYQHHNHLVAEQASTTNVL